MFAADTKMNLDYHSGRARTNRTGAKRNASQ